MKKTKAPEPFPVLYILMRSDLTSLNAGKAMAQASHAANAMVHKIRHSGPVPSKYIKNLLTRWENSTEQGFGTCLVLDCHNEVNLINVLHTYKKNKNAIADIINDPTYPVRDGDITHYISLNACGYAFFDRNDEELTNILANFSLYQ